MGVTGRRLIVWGVVAAALAAGIAYSLRPGSVRVDLATVRKATLLVTVDDHEAETRVRDMYTLYAPLTGQLLRITVDPGDAVEAGRTELARIEPAPPAMLDLRIEAERRAAVESAQAAQSLAAAELSRQEVGFAFATTELDRARKLYQARGISRRDLDEAERAYRAAQAAVASAKAALEMRGHELAQARSRLLPRAGPTEQRGNNGEWVKVTAPVSGVVLRVIRRSAGIVEAGAPLLDIGDPHNLEIVANPLSEDAVKMRPGDRAIITGWGGSDLDAVVRRIDPVGETKVSALGIEEQRVKVILDFTDPVSAWRRLGDGYRVDVRVILFRADVVQVPLGALFRNGEGWAVYLDDQGSARLGRVEIGKRNSLAVEIREGLSPGERVVVYPSDRISDGTAITPR